MPKTEAEIARLAGAVVLLCYDTGTEAYATLEATGSMDEALDAAPETLDIERLAAICSQIDSPDELFAVFMALGSAAAAFGRVVASMAGRDFTDVLAETLAAVDELSGSE